MQRKQAISLTTLVITIIIMIILAGVIIINFNNSGIITEAKDTVNLTNLKQVERAAKNLWTNAYATGSRTQEELEAKVNNGLKEIQNIDLSKIKVTVTEVGVDVRESIKYENETQVPDSWRKNVDAVVDTVPVPKGFVASQATGEDTKGAGLVIYEGLDAVTDENVDIARRTRNQYVWIPVASEAFITKFIRQNFGLSNTLTNIVGTSSQYWEVELDEVTNMPLSLQNTTYISSTTLAEVQAMYASVREYQGFYIARYEAGISSPRAEQGIDVKLLPKGKKVYSQMNKYPYTYIPWAWNTAMNEDTGGAVEVARSIYPKTNTNYGVVSTLTYGVQWDMVLQWWLDTNAVSSVIESKTYGNYMGSEINSKAELNEGAQVSVNIDTEYISKDTLTYPKSTKVTWALTTGALKVSKVNNIYDMAGNAIEWTMEGRSTYARIARGGRDGVSDEELVAHRYHSKGDTGFGLLGFRVSLYIKKAE